jgi:alpha-beta hydrolase superfamily lysophospholipase
MRTVTKGNAIDSSTLTNDEEEAAKYDADPEIHNLCSFGLAGDMLTRGGVLVERVGKDNSRSLVVNSGIPVLLVHGANDTVCKPAGSERFARALKVQEAVTSLVVADAKHEMHFELPGPRGKFFGEVSRFFSSCYAH